MDEKRFREVEEKFNILSGRFKKGEIDSETMKKELKKMMVLDGEGRYWMLGGKTGKWYVYNGKEWNEDDPYEKVVTQKKAPESFETVLFTKDQADSDISLEADKSQEKAGSTDAVGASAMADHSTIKLDKFSIEKESEAEDVDFVLGQENRSDSAFEVVSTQDYGAAVELGGEPSQQERIDMEHEAVPAREEAGGADFEVVSTQEDLSASAYEVDLSRDEGAGSHEVVLPGDDSEAAGLEVVSAQEDSAAADVDIITPAGGDGIAAGADILDAGGEEAGIIDLDASERVVEDSSTVRLDAPLQEMEAVPQAAPAPAKPPKGVSRADEIVISSIDMASLIFFLGGIGCIVGLFFGIIFGVFTGVFGNLINIFPELLRGAQGGIAGGVLFAAIGGIFGFISFAVMAAVLSAIYNFVAKVFGGIRLKIK